MNKSKITAVLLAFFLWGFGAHKFYLWEKKSWFLYLLFFRTYVPFILGIIDGIKLLFKDEISINSTDFTSNFTKEGRELKSKFKHIHQELTNSITDWVISKEDEERIEKLFDDLEIKENELKNNKDVIVFQRAVLMRNIIEGNIPECTVKWWPILNLSKWEKIIYAFDNVSYLELKSKTNYVWASSWISVRIAKWVSYRTSALKWEAIKSMEREESGIGSLIITQKHLIFSSSTKWFKIPFSKIISIQPYTDGITIQRDTAKARPECFQIQDQDFANTLIQNISLYLN